MKALTPIAVAACLLALSLGAVAAPDKDKKDNKDDVKKMEGEWKVTAWEQGGTALQAVNLEGSTWTVKGDKYTFEMGPTTEEGTIKLDPDKKPAALDLTITSGADKGKEQLGIYRIERDAIVFCLARPGDKERPTEFAATENDTHMLLMIKRARKDD